MNFFHKIGKKSIRSLQIFLIYHTLAVFCRVAVVIVTIRQRLTTIFDNHCKMRIDIIVILCVILMIGRRYKNRIEVNCFNTKLLQIIKFIQNPLQISAVKFTHIHQSRVSSPFFHLVYMRTDITVFIVHDIIRLIAIAETICVDLVHNRPFCPVRRMKSRIQAIGILWIWHIHISLLIKIHYGTAFFNLEIIRKWNFSQFHFDGIKIKYLVGVFFAHFTGRFFMNQINLVYIPFCRTATKSYLSVCFWFQWGHKSFCAGTKDCVST